VDLDDATSLEAALAPDLAAVLVCVPQSEPRVQVACLERGLPCVDLGITAELANSVRALDTRAREARVPVVALAGMWPGLSGLMGKRAAALVERVRDLNLFLCQSTQSRVGPTGIADMLGTLSRPVVLHEEKGDRRVQGFSVQRQVSYPEPFGRHRHHLIALAEAPILSEVLGLRAVNCWTGFDSGAFDFLLRGLCRLGVLQLFRHERMGVKLATMVNWGKSLGPERPEPVALVAEARGEQEGAPRIARVSLRGPSDYGTSAMAGVAIARLASERGADAAGAGHPVRFFDLNDVIETVDSPELDLSESIES
jgi:hypothetical protein